MSEELSPVAVRNIFAAEVAAMDREARTPADWCWHCGERCRGHKLESPLATLDLERE